MKTYKRGRNKKQLTNTEDLKKMFVIIQKYMKHVEQCEGVTFVSDINSGKSKVEFSTYEENFLKTVESQIEEMWNE